VVHLGMCTNMAHWVLGPEQTLLILQCWLVMQLQETLVGISFCTMEQEQVLCI